MKSQQQQQIQTSLYIQKENQQLLWEMLHKTPQISQVFDPSSQTQKQTWFRGIIANFHDKTPIVQNRDQLLAMNRQTLSYMITQMNNNIKPPNNSTTNANRINNTVGTNTTNSSTSNSTNNSTGVTTMYSRNMQTENREDIYKRQFEEREREYKTMSAPPELPKVNFALSEDNAISNMAELVEQHRKLRELDTQMPTQSIPSSIPSIEPGSQKLKIQQELSKEESIEFVELSPPLPQKPRKVTWESDNPIDHNSITQSIENLNVQIREIKEVLFRLFDKIVPTPPQPSTIETIETIEMIETIANIAKPLKI
jgi:hypothetical protein